MHGTLDQWMAHGMIYAFLAVFVSGVATSLTPCVYPLIPITVGVFGARDENVSKVRAFTLGWMYVLGIVVMYTVLGIVVALSSHGIPHFGVWLSNPWVVGPIALLFIALAASMFGAFELQLPFALQQRLSKVGGRGFGGAFAMGLVGGILAAPCTGPVLLALLTYVATTRNVALGGSLLAVYALGMGMLFLLIATFSLKLPKSGRWMEVVKSVFGLVFIVAALYFLRPAWPWLERVTTSRSFGFLGLGVAGLVGGVAAGGAHLSFHDTRAKQVRKAAGVALAAVGAFVVLGWLLTPSREVEWRRDIDKALADAASSHTPVLMDFGAAWCGPCKKLEVVTFADKLVASELDKFVAIKVKVDDDSPEIAAAVEKYNAAELPTVIVLDGSGKRIWTGHEVGPDELLAALRSAE